MKSLIFIFFIISLNGLGFAQVAKNDRHTVLTSTVWVLDTKRINKEQTDNNTMWLDSTRQTTSTPYLVKQMLKDIEEFEAYTFAFLADDILVMQNIASKYVFTWSLSPQKDALIFSTTGTDGRKYQNIHKITLFTADYIETDTGLWLKAKND